IMLDHRFDESISKRFCLENGYQWINRYFSSAKVSTFKHDDSIIFTDVSSFMQFYLASVPYTAMSERKDIPSDKKKFLVKQVKKLAYGLISRQGKIILSKPVGAFIVKK
ncbi:MAG: hypothetical protein MUO72_11740, partial [Bacteroidales bacterium]|nr:hypothetical protein [Bacteroidales bacterium]